MSQGEKDDPRAYPHQYQRARAVWELMFEIKADTTYYQTGDVNSDGMIDIGDIVYLVSYLYKNGPAPSPVDAGDCNCDGIVDIADVVCLINYLYRGGDPPSC